MTLQSNSVRKARNQDGGSENRSMAQNDSKSVFIPKGAWGGMFGTGQLG